MYTYGQQHTVPNDVVATECIYFTTEVYDAAVVDNRNAVITRALGGIFDVLSISDYAWTVAPQNTTPAVNGGWARDNYWGNIFMRGFDEYTLRNQSNETVRLVGYLCTARKDSIKYNGSLQNNVYNYLGQGFSENGIDANVTDATNRGLVTSNLTPRNSRYFCRTFKILRQFRKRIAPGKIIKQKIFYKWHKHTPADLVQSTGSTNTTWSARTIRFDKLKGEKFVLWRLEANIGGIAGQTTITKNIAQTTPTVIMETQRHYWFKHFNKPLGPALDFTAIGTATTTASIIIDADEQKGAETDAS